MKLPDKLRVGPYDIVIGSLDPTAQKDNYGTFSAIDMEIRLCNDFKSPHKAAETVIHELLHAIYYTAGIHPKDGEERTVNAFAVGMAQVIRDNPKLIDWLKASLK